MAEEGTFCINADVLKKAGANASTTSTAEAYSNVFIKQAEGRIMTMARSDLKSNYGTLNAETKELLREAASNLAAIYAIQYDMSGFTSRIEAEDMINVLLFNFKEAMKILSDQKTITYSEASNTVSGGITVQEIDGAPNVSSVKTIKVTNGALTDNGSGVVTLDVSGHAAVTLAASATTGGLSLSTQEIGFRAATNAQTGYATATHITNLEAASAHVADNTQAHSDYLLNSGADEAVGPLTITADNSTADQAYVPMVLYNTDATPPAASGFPIGTLYIQYTP